jgi:aminoglycoside phosphotransferase (APT) family kinase protein
MRGTYRNALACGVPDRETARVKMHEDQLTVSEAMVRDLVDAQFPQWRSLALRPVASHGTVNAIFRIGDELAARFPLQPGDVDAARQGQTKEADAARELFGVTRFPTPEPVAIGEPGSGYPMPWSVQTWLPGTIAYDEDPGSSVAFAYDLAEFVSGVRAIPTRGRTFSGHGRGGELRRHDDWMERCFRNSEGLMDVGLLRRTWNELRDLPRLPRPDVMNHADIMPGNVLVAGGRLAGVLDCGGLGPADPALDLMCAWHLLDSGPREVLRTTMKCDDLEWERGQAWAFEQALGALWYYAETNPVMSATGRRTLERILEARR